MDSTPIDRGDGLWRPLNFDALHPKYQVFEDDVLGSGTFGIVYAGKQVFSGEKVAVKCISQQTEYQRRAFEKELLTLNVLTQEGHKHVLALWDSARQPDGNFLVFPRCATSLAIRIDRLGACKTLVAVKSLAMQLCLGLEYCHDHGVLHGDLHPGNILLSELCEAEPCAYIADFGYSEILQRGEWLPFTHLLCPLPYRAPENLLQTSCNVNYDMWSLACIVIELMSAKPLVRPRCSTQFGALIRIFQLVGTPTESSWPGVSDVRDFKPDFPQFRVGSLPKIWMAAGRELTSDEELLNRGLNFVQRCLTPCPKLRFPSKDAAIHCFFQPPGVSIRYLQHHQHNILATTHSPDGATSSCCTTFVREIAKRFWNNGFKPSTSQAAESDILAVLEMVARAWVEEGGLKKEGDDLENCLASTAGPPWSVGLNGCYDAFNAKDLERLLEQALCGVFALTATKSSVDVSTKHRQIGNTFVILKYSDGSGINIDSHPQLAGSRGMLFASSQSCASLSNYVFDACGVLDTTGCLSSHVMVHSAFIKIPSRHVAECIHVSDGMDQGGDPTPTAVAQSSNAFQDTVASTGEVGRMSVGLFGAAISEGRVFAPASYAASQVLTSPVLQFPLPAKLAHQAEIAPDASVPIRNSMASYVRTVSGASNCLPKSVFDSSGLYSADSPSGPVQVAERSAEAKSHRSNSPGSSVALTASVKSKREHLDDSPGQNASVSRGVAMPAAPLMPYQEHVRRALQPPISAERVMPDAAVDADAVEHGSAECQGGIANGPAAQTEEKQTGIESILAAAEASETGGGEAARSVPLIRKAEVLGFPFCFLYSIV